MVTEKVKRFRKGTSVSNDVDIVNLPPKAPRKIEFKITTKTGIVTALSRKQNKKPKSPSK